MKDSQPTLLPPPLSPAELVKRALEKLSDEEASRVFGIGILELYAQRRRLSR